MDQNIGKARAEYLILRGMAVAMGASAVQFDRNAGRLAHELAHELVGGGIVTPALWVSAARTLVANLEAEGGASPTDYAEDLAAALEAEYGRRYGNCGYINFADWALDVVKTAEDRGQVLPPVALVAADLAPELRRLMETSAE
jgi:hypothetical protein